jgi:hypothetical protein
MQNNIKIPSSTPAETHRNRISLANYRLDQTLILLGKNKSNNSSI